MPIIMTASTGPTEQSAIDPKLFSPSFLVENVEAMPMPSAIMNGTVIGPVVTPPESNASAVKLLPPLAIITDASAKRTR